MGINSDKILRSFINLVKRNIEFEIAVSGRSMEPYLYSGDKVRIRNSDTYKEEDIVIIYHDSHLIIHRIIEIVVQGDEYFYKTKGDNNHKPDGLFHESKLIGIAAKIG